MQEKITPEEIQIVVARLKSIPENALIAIGGLAGSLSKDDMIKEVENGTEIGREIVLMHMTYLRSFKKG